METKKTKLKTIIIDKLAVKGVDDNNCFKTFAQTVKGEVPFKLFFYFMSFENGATFKFRPGIFAKDYNVSTPGTTSAFSALESQGYIKLDENGDYHFRNYVMEENK